MNGETSAHILDVANLAVGFQTEKGKLFAVDGISFRVKKGQTLAIVGESGCGKSVTSLAIMGLLPELGGIEGGSISFEGIDIGIKSDKELRKLRGNRMAMIFQEPMTALNPVYTVGEQIMEVFRIHRKWTKAKCYDESLAMLKKVQIPDPERRMHEYPFQMSGGMRQRILIAMALACKPELLIADEPTTALDVTIQAQILRLIKELQQEFNTAVIFITHDLGVVSQIADEIVVMYAGKIIESGTIFDIFDHPAHPYTKGLLSAIPKIDGMRHTKLPTIEGLVPSLHQLPSGCRFRNRCPYAAQICSSQLPDLEQVSNGHLVACHKWREVENGCTS